MPEASRQVRTIRVTVPDRQNNIIEAPHYVLV